MKNQRLRVAAYALIHDESRILLCRLSKEVPEWAGAWTLPGGGLQFGESPDIAVIREVFEETGLMIKVGSIAGIDNIFIKRDHEEFQGLRIIYNATITGGLLRNELAGTTDRCEWQPLENLPNLKIVELVESAVNLLKPTA